VKVGGWSEAKGATPLVFGTEARPLFGFLHPASGPRPGGIGFVLCNPIGYEAMCAHRAYRNLAERLAAHGYPALRFDYHGTGDSSGQPDEPGRVSAWLDGIDQALDEMRSRTGVHALGLVGTRFGGTLAAVLAARRGDVDSLVLWAPSLSGRAYARELRAFRMIKQARGLAPGPLRDRGEEAAGYFFDRATLAEVSAIDLLAGKERVARRVLIVPRDDLPGGEEDLARALEKAGADVRIAAEPGYQRMMRDPQETVVPISTLDRMIEWVDEGRYPEPRGPVVPPSVPRVMIARARRTDAPVSERALHFGEDDRLFGILTEPADLPASRARPAILLLNVGANHRVGPNRMYVVLARDLATLGYATLRFDVAGLGDSSIAPGKPDNRLYSKDSVGDVKTAMSMVTNLCGHQRFVLVGLCSGAYLAFHTCVEDPRVAGQILLNPQTFEWKEGDSLELSIRKSFLSTRYYVRALFNPSAWKRGIRGQLNVRGVAAVLRERLVSQARALVRSANARTRGRDQPQTDIERAFRAVSDRGVQSLLVFSFEEHLGRNARRMPKASFRLEIIDGADHTFTPIDSQDMLYDLLVHYLAERFP